jgi:hypothetical protein
LRLIRPNHGLKLEHRGENQRAIQSQNAMPRPAFPLDPSCEGPLAACGKY